MEALLESILRELKIIGEALILQTALLGTLLAFLPLLRLPSSTPIAGMGGHAIGWLRSLWKAIERRWTGLLVGLSDRFEKSERDVRVWYKTLWTPLLVAFAIPALPPALAVASHDPLAGYFLLTDACLTKGMTLVERATCVRELLPHRAVLTVVLALTALMAVVWSRDPVKRALPVYHLAASVGTTVGIVFAFHAYNLVLDVVEILIVWTVFCSLSALLGVVLIFIGYQVLHALLGFVLHCKEKGSAVALGLLLDTGAVLAWYGTSLAPEP